MSYEHLEVAHRHSHETENNKRLIVFTTTVWALLIAVSSFGSENMNHESILYKNESSNQWAYFQAKSMKERLYELEVSRLSDTLPNSPLFNEHAQKALELQAEIIRYKTEEEEIQISATKATQQSEVYDKKGNKFELARIFFELAIVLNALFLLSSRKHLLDIAYGAGAIGIINILWVLFL